VKARVEAGEEVEMEVEAEVVVEGEVIVEAVVGSLELCQLLITKPIWTSELPEL
jgi:hypothetical protein